MSVQLFIITHDEIGRILLDVIKHTFGVLPLPTEILGIRRQCDPNKIVTKALSLMEKWQNPEGILILTDIFGSTPSNIAERLHEKPNTRLVSGLNLPMLIRVMNYPLLSLDELTEKAVSGGREGILECT